MTGVFPLSAIACRLGAGISADADRMKWRLKISRRLTCQETFQYASFTAGNMPANIEKFIRS
jgi:hypothetical protein